MVQPERIEVSAGTEMVVTWDDGRVDRIAANVLRDACPCAGCQNPDVPPMSSDPEVTRIAAAALVGAYALNVVFAPDGHSSGIFPFKDLRALAAG